VLPEPAEAESLRPDFERAAAHHVGTSGTVTSLAGVHLRLPRYQRSKVDGLWVTREQALAASLRLREMCQQERAAEPCVGPERADLVLAGCAILETVSERWPAGRLRVADRGLREGLLMSLMHGSGRGRRGGRRRRGGCQSSEPR
ncbi:MAG: Ppx/GppA family phosphatase, partial [Caulobacterales bacterium]|nr:Ppx/GppA family phosphatase [Caulobacterales bacterium]